jgi:hypothetical protein
VFPAGFKKPAFIVETYVEKTAAPAQTVGKIKRRRAPFIQFLPAMRTQCLIFHNLCHPFSPYRKRYSTKDYLHAARKVLSIPGYFTNNIVY